MIRVLVVDDSITQRRAIADRLAASGLVVVGEAVDGRDAVAQTHKLRPDVVLMDIVMPHVDGLAATRQILTEIPTPVVILSSFVDSQNEYKTLDALAAGALEVCAKPMMGSPRERQDWDHILMTVAAAAQVRAIRRIDRPKADVSRPVVPAPPPTATLPRRSVVVIGASTGGPSALRQIFGDLTPDFPLPIVVALHCNSRLSSSVAGWFDRDCDLHVRDAEDGRQLPQAPGTVITAPPGRNLSLHRGRTVITDGTGHEGCTPGIDELFTSTAKSYGPRAIGVLLTGMGSDGAIGLKRIREQGGCTVAQDEASCVVFGMPAAAIRLGSADHVTPLDDIAALLTRLAFATTHSSPALRERSP